MSRLGSTSHQLLRQMVRSSGTTARVAPFSSTSTASSLSRTTLPIHPVVVGHTQLNRLQEHYRNTMVSDLLYMTYDPSLDTSLHSDPSSSSLSSSSSSSLSSSLPSSESESTSESPSATELNEARLRKWDPSNPYAKSRPVRPPKGNRRLQPLAKPFSTTQTLKDLPRIEKIIISSFCKDAVANKHALIPLIAQIRAITGLSPASSNSDPALRNAAKPGAPNSGRGHIEIVRAKSGIASFKLRPGVPVGVKATLPGPVAYEFLEILTTFVLPRLRSFQGFPLPPASQPPMSPAALSGCVSLGLTHEAMPLFPQIDINLDQYPHRPLGFQIECITNQRGKKATDRARTLLSGLGIPFVRRGDM